VKNIVFTTGKRKRSIARARFKPGSGSIRINNQPLELMPNEILKLKIKEPLIIAGDAWKKFDINIDVSGGGVMGQAEAVRQAIARGLAEYLGQNVKKEFLSYDRNLLVYDPRRTEPHKPPRSSQGPRRYKQRSKR
jgi:small subunit ribosomal protein S9